MYVIDAGTSDTFNDSEGVLMAEISALADDGQVENYIADGTSINRIIFNLTASNTLVNL